MRAMRSTKAATLAVVAAAAMGIVACGSNDDPSSSTGASAPAAGTAAAKAPSGPAFNIGFICSCSGAQAAQLGGMDDVYQAWADNLNAQGGLAGHPIKVTIKDDGGDPARATQAVKELVEQTKVQAIVDTSLADAAFAPYLAKARVPVVGGISLSLPFLTIPTFFPAGGTFPITTLGTLLQAKEAGKKHLGLGYCAESPVCKQLVPIAQGAAKLAGMTVTPIGISQTAASYAAPCTKLKDEGVDAMYVSAAQGVVSKMVAACKQQGFSPTRVSTTNTTGVTWLKDKNMEGTRIVGTNAANSKEYNDVVAKYAKDREAAEASPFINSYPWSAAKLFEAVVAAGNLTPASTRAEIIDAMYKIKPGETLKGVAPPLTFTKGKPATPDCYFVQHIAGGKFVADNGNKPVCVTPEQAKFNGAVQAQVTKATG